jgi:hypothetical protein
MPRCIVTDMLITAARVPCRALMVTLLLAAASHEAAAQWAGSIDVTEARFWGGSREQDGDRAFHPYRPTIIGIGLERQMLGFSVGVRGYYAGASLALEGGDAVTAVKGALDLHGIAVELSHRVGSLGKTVDILVYGGPVIEVWDLADQSSSTHAGFTGAIGLVVGLGGRFSGIIKAGAAVTPSPFSTDDLDVGFEPRALWRREMSGRLRFGL